MTTAAEAALTTPKQIKGNLPSLETPFLADVYSATRWPLMAPRPSTGHWGLPRTTSPEIPLDVLVRKPRNESLLPEQPTLGPLFIAERNYATVLPRERMQKWPSLREALSPLWVSNEREVTFEEFVCWCDEDTWAEWIDGKVIEFSPASTRHQDIAGLLSGALRVYAEARGLGKVLCAPYQMWLPEQKWCPEPDVLFVKRANVGRLRETRLVGPADMVVEILSPESKERDREDKFRRYAMAGVTEYWLVDPDGHDTHFYQLGTDLRYREILTTAGTYYSEAVPGFFVRMSWFDPASVPSLVDLVKEFGLL